MNPRAHRDTRPVNKLGISDNHDNRAGSSLDGLHPPRPAPPRAAHLDAPRRVTRAPGRGISYAPADSADALYTYNQGYISLSLRMIADNAPLCLYIFVGMADYTEACIHEADVRRETKTGISIANFLGRVLVQYYLQLNIL